MGPGIGRSEKEESSYRSEGQGGRRARFHECLRVYGIHCADLLLLIFIVNEWKPRDRLRGNGRFRQNQGMHPVPVSELRPFLLPLAVSVGLSLVPGGKYALYPFKLFTTWVHECGHALAALTAGGGEVRITLEPDASGLTRYRLPRSRLREAWVASAGYLGSSLVGCALFYLSATERARAPQIVLGLAVALGLSLLLWVRNAFGAATVLALGAGLGACVHYGRAEHVQWLLQFLALQTALNACLDIRTLFGLGGGARGQSDAHTMQRLFWLPAAFWAALWMAASLTLMAWVTGILPAWSGPGLIK